MTEFPPEPLRPRRGIAFWALLAAMTSSVADTGSATDVALAVLGRVPARLALLRRAAAIRARAVAPASRSR